MSTPARKTWKLQEFVAHGSNVNCLALGHKSGRVLVTGGDDKKVNLWAVGKHSCIMSLSGHVTPVECVRFGHTEELVCAGSQAGAIKIWDLEAAKLVRTLTGHKCSIRCVDFHPYGDFLISGSLDTSIKLWDIRRRGCIFTYKGHKLTVNSLKFSPDGQWVASGGEEGSVKIWDLRTGRMLQEFVDHTGPVTAVQFHPSEFLLASSSADRSVNFWDLEKFQVVSSTAKESAAIRAIHFSAGGECLFAGTQDALRVYGWEPARVLDAVQVGWGRVQDMATTASDQLVGAAFLAASVTLHVVDLRAVRPLGRGDPEPPASAAFARGQGVRKSFSREKPLGISKPILDVKTIEESDKSGTDPEDDAQSVAEIPNVQDYRDVFQPNRSQPPPEPQALQPILPVVEGVKGPPELLTPPYSPPPTRQDTAIPRPRAPAPTQVKHAVRPLGFSKEAPAASEPVEPVRLNSLRHSPSEPSLYRPNGHKRSHSLSRNLAPASKTQASSAASVPTASYSRPTARPVAAPSSPVRLNCPVVQSKGSDREDDDFVPMASDKPTGLSLDDFLPRNGTHILGYERSRPEMSEEEVLSSITRGHDSMMVVLSNRQRSLQIVYSVWHNKDSKAAIDSAVAMNDPSVLVDLLGVLCLRPAIWNLDLCVALLPTIYELIQSKYELYMKVGSDSLRLVLRNFAPIIKTNVHAPIQTVGVDISREERYTKCVNCYKKLMSVRAFLLKRQTLQGKLGQTFRELLLLMEGLD
ncbi:katanin p80 WD40 repeat-containing subunit B1 isoform X2 [Bacillus rossius redtenbacheri]|uniref:katanin p80 WD40 repeat-containing subunit B1 isoform X2 n=1 Tax=Bacillus rossius redtenbacheri TaxID=93214 RepID=UPI002FDE1C8A